MNRYWWPGLLVLLAGPLREPMESSMVLHMLVQLPLLGLVGWQLWSWIQQRMTPVLLRWDRHGIAGLLCAVFTLLVWMVPRNLDAALNDPVIDGAKFATMMVLVGSALHWSWPRLSCIIRGLVWSNLIAMLLVMGWLYLAAPMRVCINYANAQQTLAGNGFLVAAVGVTLWLVVSLFVQRGSDEANPSGADEKVAPCGQQALCRE